MAHICNNMDVTANSPRAHEINVSQTRALIKDNFPQLGNAVSHGKYAFWIGSGISRDKLDNVPVFVMKILTHLQQNIDSTDSNCKYGRAFSDALNLAGLSQAEWEQVEISTSYETWPIRGVIVERLSSKYSDLLEIDITGEVSDFLLWEVLDVPGTYGSSATEPDLEHICLAVLMMEGVIPELVTANWDGLIEKAVRQLAPDSQSIISVYVKPEDFRQHRGRSRILKFHGCAVQAIKSPSEYRKYLVGRRTQITDWPNDSDHFMMRQEMCSIAANHETLMIGLSAQDVNIQNLFSAAQKMLAWNWPVDPPAFVFAEDSIGLDQKSILRVGYGATYNGNEAEIADASLVRAFAKPLLSALVLSVLASKLIAFATLASNSYPPTEVESIAAGIDALTSIAAEALDDDMVGATGQLIRDVGRAMSIFRSGKNPDIPHSYTPLGAFPVGAISDDPGFQTSGLPEMALAISILGNCVLSGSMKVSWLNDSNDDLRAPFSVESNGLTSKLFFASTSTAVVEYVRSGLVDETDPNTILIHSAEIAVPQQRAPSAAPGRTGRPAARHIDMSDLLSSSWSYDELQKKFREGFGV